ncbi:MAG: universal stress protein [Acidobacteriota bacterium]|nr:universal stress protein [Acidobacteriota bacterium]MDQ7088523.1 universal stress protein [Acidobacteriota bacterium]
MLPVERILCPTDFSDPARHALDTAAELARHFQAQLLVLTVIDPLPAMHAPVEGAAFDLAAFEKDREAAARRRLSELVETGLGEGLAARPLVTHGCVYAQIVAAAEEHDADLIVIATHGWTGWRRLLFGSVAEKVVRTAHRPVLIVHQPEQERAGAA